jgi:hypothetical protein
MDLIVDASLDDINRDLKAIHDEFTNAKHSAEENNGIWGQRDLSQAMDAFANNWYVHRDAINERLGKLSERVDQACNTWNDADKQLTQSLETEDGDADA